MHTKNFVSAKKQCPPYIESLLASVKQQHIIHRMDKKTTTSCSQHVALFPSTGWAKQCLYQSAHYTCRKEQQLPEHFASLGSLASAQYVQP